MSYCRFSSDIYRSDVYVYESNSGWEVYVASRKLAVEVPDKLDAMPCSTPQEWVAVSLAAHAWRRSLEDESGDIPDRLWVSLGELGEEAGQSYVTDSPGECAELLRQLQAKGFRIPDGVIDVLEEEEREQ